MYSLIFNIDHETVFFTFEFYWPRPRRSDLKEFKNVIRFRKKTVSTEIISIVIRSKICVSTKILLEDGQASLRCGKKHNIKILAGKLPQWKKSKSSGDLIILQQGISPILRKQRTNELLVITISHDLLMNTEDFKAILQCYWWMLPVVYSKNNTKKETTIHNWNAVKIWAHNSFWALRTSISKIKS